MGRNKLDWIKTLGFSVGLSIVFIMFIGLITNSIGYLGFKEPLSLTVLTATAVLMTVLLAIVNYYKNRTVSADFKDELSFGKIALGKSKWFVILIIIPLLSIIAPFSGGLFTQIIILMLILIAILIGACILGNVPSKFYPLIIFVVALALMFHTSLVSNHLNGFDVQHEYKFMQITAENSYWQINYGDKLSSMLSLTILPTFYHNIIGIDFIWISNVIFPLLFIFVPLMLYKFFENWFEKKTSFLSVFFFIAYSSFYAAMIFLGRQMIAELFFVLILFVLFTNDFGKAQKTILFTIFSFGAITSHYAIAEILLVVLFAAWLITYLFNKGKITLIKIPFSYVLIFGVLIFSWYIYVGSSATFNDLTAMLTYVYNSTISNFFDLGSRGSDVLIGVGVGSAPTSPINFVGRLWAYATELLIILGFIYLLLRRRVTFDKTFFSIVSINMFLLVLSIILPNFAGSLGMERLYHIVLMSVAPLLMIGIRTIAHFTGRHKQRALTIISLLVIVPFFLFQTGLIYEVAHVTSYSIPLSRYRFDSSIYFTLGMIEQTDISGVRWLSTHVQDSIVYSDYVTDSILVRGGYGMVPYNQTKVIISNATAIGSGGLVYLRYFNLHFNTMSSQSVPWNTTDYDTTLNDFSMVYSNGLCNVYKKP
jgi:uncharacterized membrane protein